MNKVTMFGRGYYVWVVSAVVATEVLIFSMIRLLHFESEIKVGIATFTAMPLFVVALMELGRNLRLQRAAFIKDYVSQFFTNAELYRTFHDLIYTYSNQIFEELNKVCKDQKLETLDTPVFEPFEVFQKGRQEGARLYHPDVFQNSPEERRLDALLGYFDVIAYYYAKGYLRIEDIAGSVGYFLAVMKARQVVCEYIKLAHKVWSTPEVSRTMGATPPFAYLERLLDDIQKYNERFAEDIKKLQKRRL